MAQVKERQKRSFNLDDFVLATLDNFAYRYFTQGTAQKLQEGAYGVKSQEESGLHGLGVEVVGHSVLKVTAYTPETRIEEVPFTDIIELRAKLPATLEKLLSR